MIEKTPALVLRYAPTGNTSRVVTWLTPNQGRVATLIKGALRPKSLFLGQYDLFYTCELLYYHRPHQELFISRECSPIKPRPAFRHDWRACAAASYLSDLALRISPAQAPQSFLYHWLESGLDALEIMGDRPALLFWLELKLLDQMGLAPRLRTCRGCNAPLSPERGTLAFSNARGGLLCARCARTDAQPAQPIPPDVLAMLRNWQQAPDAQSVRRTVCTPRQQSVMERLLGEFLRYHLDLPLPSRDLAFSILKRNGTNDGHAW